METLHSIMSDDNACDIDEVTQGSHKANAPSYGARCLHSNLLIKFVRDREKETGRMRNEFIYSKKFQRR